MTFHPLLFLLLLGHVIGDFYAQTDKMSKDKSSNNKKPRRKGLAVHGLCYALVMVVVLFPVVQFSSSLAYIFLTVSISHFALDSVKRHIKWKPFIVDQALHIAVIFLVWAIFNGDTIIWPYVVALDNSISPRISQLSQNPYWTLLGVLIILRPVGYLIKSNEIWNFGSIIETNSHEIKPNSISPHAGRMIGYLERLIVFFLLLSSAMGTIGFVIAAKAAIRFPEIINETDKTQKRNHVEYFLIGTLLSMVCAFVVYLLLQITNNILHLPDCAGTCACICTILAY